MPAYKDKAKGTWYASFYYEDWTGKNETGLSHQAGGSRVGADIPATTDRRPGNDL